MRSFCNRRRGVTEELGALSNLSMLGPLRQQKHQRKFAKFPYQDGVFSAVFSTKSFQWQAQHLKPSIGTRNIMKRMAETEWERREPNLGSRVSSRKNCSNHALPLKLLEGASLKEYPQSSEKKIVIVDSLPQEIFQKWNSIVQK